MTTTFACFPVCIACRDSGVCETPLVPLPKPPKRTRNTKPRTMATAPLVWLECGCQIPDFGYMVIAGEFPKISIYCPDCKYWTKKKSISAPPKTKGSKEVKGQEELPPF